MIHVTITNGDLERALEIGLSVGVYSMIAGIGFGLARLIRH